MRQEEYQELESALKDAYTVLMLSLILNFFLFVGLVCSLLLYAF